MSCSKCGSDSFIVNKTHNLCFQCNHIRLHKETPFDTFKRKAFISREADKARQSIKTKKKPSQNSVKPPKKATGEREMFIEIWNEREHYCHNLNCRKYLGDEPRPIYFSHRKGKGAYPELRLDKTNIDLLCQECHYCWDFSDKTKIKLQ